MARHLNPDLPAYAKNLIKFRKYAGLTQKELAERTLMSEFTIQKWENGQRLPEFKPLFILCNLISLCLLNDIPGEYSLTEERFLETKSLSIAKSF